MQRAYVQYLLICLLFLAPFNRPPLLSLRKAILTTFTYRGRLPGSAKVSEGFEIGYTQELLVQGSFARYVWLTVCFQQKKSKICEILCTTFHILRENSEFGVYRRSVRDLSLSPTRSQLLACRSACAAP